MDILEELGGILKKCGITEWGVCAFSQISGRLLECRAKDRLPAGAQSAVLALFPYYVSVEKRNLSRYAVVPDYHITAGKMLEKAALECSKVWPDRRFVPFIDNSPVPEVYAAAKAGLGAVGKQGLLLHPKYGSWVFIGEIVTDLPVPVKEHEILDCIGCGACIKACPVSAVKGEGGIDPTVCLSAVSQKKGELSQEEAERLRGGGLAWGCDICQEVCPYNKRPLETPIQEFVQGAHPLVQGDTFDKLPDRAYLWRGKKVMERNLKLFRGEGISREKENK